MEVLKDYPKEFAKAFQTSFSFLFKVNMKFWFNDEGWLTRYWRFLYIVPVVVIFAATRTVNVCNLMKGGQIFEIAYQLPPFLVMIHAVLKVLVLFPKTTQITNIIKELGSLWRITGMNERQIKDRHTLLRRVILCNTGTYWVSIIGTTQYLLSPLFETLFYKFILRQDTELLLPIASSYPFDPTGNWLVYVAAYAFQTYSMFLCVMAYTGTELMMITLCALLSIEFTLLSEDLLLVKPSKKKLNGSGAEDRNDINDDGASYRIEDFVKKHQKLISLSKQIDNVFNGIVFIDLLFTGGTTCFFRYAGQFSRGPTYMASNYVALLCSLFYVLFMCYYGEQLIGASVRIGEVAYESLWYKGDRPYQRIIFMIIKRSQNACCLTSIKYVPVTFNMFTKVSPGEFAVLAPYNANQALVGLNFPCLGDLPPNFT